MAAGRSFRTEHDLLQGLSGGECTWRNALSETSFPQGRTAICSNAFCTVMDAGPCVITGPYAIEAVLQRGTAARGIAGAYRERALGRRGEVLPLAAGCR